MFANATSHEKSPARLGGRMSARADGFAPPKQGRPVHRLRAPLTGRDELRSHGGESADSGTPLPEPILRRVEQLSRIPMGEVRVHYNSKLPRDFSAGALTKGTAIHLAPGGESLLPHEAWHAVQQKQGRVRSTERVGGLPFNSDHRLESEADRMGEAIGSGELPSTERGPVGSRPIALIPRVTMASAPIQAGRTTGRSLRKSTRKQTYRSRKFSWKAPRGGGRITLTSAQARAWKKRSSEIERMAKVALHSHLPGSYAQQYVSGGTLINKGKGFGHQIDTEVDHIPTDSSQRGVLSRDAKANATALVQRPAMALPKTWHRRHPTTVGGYGLDPAFRAQQKAHVERTAAASYTDLLGVVHKGYAAATAMHLDAYDAIVGAGPKYGKNVYKAARENAKFAIDRARTMGHIQASEKNHLKQLANRVFRTR